MPVDAFGPLVTPDEPVDLLLAVARHDGGSARREHLRALERAKDLPDGTLRDFRSVGRLHDEDDRQPQDALPSLLLYNAGTARTPEMDDASPGRALSLAWTIGAEIAYHGANRTDALRGAYWYAWAAAQLLLQRTPRNGIVQWLRLTDVEPAPGGTQRVMAVRLLLEVGVGDALASFGAPPVALPDAPAPLPLPVDPPDPSWPDVTSASADATKEPL